MGTRLRASELLGKPQGDFLPQRAPEAVAQTVSITHVHVPQHPSAVLTVAGHRC